MKALVTGGAGFIGSNIVRLLLEQGHQVSILDNLQSGYRSNLDPFPQVKFVEGDLRDEHKLEEAITGADLVFHLAASVGNTRSIENPIEDSDINVMGTLRLLEKVRQHGIRRLVYSSSAGIFGELKTLPIKEDHPIDPDTPYGASKLAAEKLCLAYGKLYAIQVACLRYFNVYGVNQRYDAYGNVIPIFAHRMLHDEPVIIFDDGEQTRDFVNVRDVALANYRAATTDGVFGAFNVASGTSVTINQLVELMSEAGGISPHIEYHPPRKGDVRNSRADITAAGLSFAFEPTVDLRSGLRQYMDWARQELSTRSL